MSDDLHRDTLTDAERAWWKRFKAVLAQMPPSVFALALREGGCSLHRVADDDGHVGAGVSLAVVHHPRMGQHGD